ncbi:hypothetical protein SDC9_168326 [bioreactor metagenome]|uniref:Uncharacterized protein n=1 Tax=bioreactor metagenome TaxID=1076179 RepID=A0A645G265_9ZZZZ
MAVVLAQVGPFEDLAALAIDDLALLVHHVVVFQHGLSGLEVPRLHGGLGVFDGLGEHFALNGRVLVQIHPLHDTGNPVAAEQAHQIVLQGDIEPGFPGVALTARAAAELVVNPAGVVALGADDEQAACFPDLFRHVGNLRLVAGKGLGIPLPGVQNLLAVGFGIAGGLANQLVGHTGFTQIRLRHILGVAAQHDIRAAASHVGGHGDGAQLARLRDDLRFLLVVLGVEDAVGNALVAQKSA